MERCEYIEIAGKIYPMRMSMAASEEINRKWGTLDKMLQECSKEETCITAYIDCVDILIKQGCAYKNMFEKDLPKPEKAAVENEEWKPLSREMLAIGLDRAQIPEIIKKIKNVCRIANKNEVEGDSTSKKNEKEE